MAVLLLEPAGYSPRAVTTYGQLGEVWHGEVPPGRETEVAILVIRLAHHVDGKMLDRFPHLRCLATPTTGLTHVDVEACRVRGVEVVSLRDCREAIDGVTSTSELALGLIIALLRHIPASHADVISAGRWDRDRFRSRQLSRLSLGLVGLGRIGGHVAGYARALGMRVAAFDPFQPERRFSSLEVVRVNELPSLAARSDILSVHAALRDDNVNLVGREVIAALPAHALLINTARGALIDETAAVAALRAGRLGGIAADVLTEEHSGRGLDGSPLLTAARDGLNVILTPHIGGCTVDAMHITEECVAERVVERLRRGS